MNTNENTQSAINFIYKIFQSQDGLYFYLRLSFYFLIIGVIVFYFSGTFSNNDDLKSGIKTIKISKVFVEGKGEFQGINKEVEYLNNFLNKQEVVLKERDKGLLEKINSAMPDDVSPSSTAKFFEDLFLSLSTKGNEMILESVNVSNPISETLSIGDKKIRYKKYPVNVSFISSHNKKMQFLDIIQASGSMDKRYYFKGQALPLMTVSSVSMNVGNKKITGEKQNQNISFFIYSYNEKENI